MFVCRQSSLTAAKVQFWTKFVSRFCSGIPGQRGRRRERSERSDQQEQEETLNDYIQDITLNSIMNEVDDLDISVFRPNSDMSRSNAYEENTNWANFGARPRSSPPRTRSRATEDQGPSSRTRSAASQN